MSGQRKYRRFQKFVPKDENMFWKEYKIVDELPGRSHDSEKLGFSYLVECTPKDPDKLETRRMVIVEKLLDTMINISEKAQYKIKIVGEYDKLGSKVVVTEKDPSTGLEFPYYNASVWVNESPNFERNEFVLKTYSENAGLLNTLLENNIVTLLNKTVIVGRSECPVVKLTGKDTWYL